MSSKAINKLTGVPNHEEDEYSVLNHGCRNNIAELVTKLCQDDVYVRWATGKNNQNNIRALPTSWTPLFGLISAD